MKTDEFEMPPMECRARRSRAVFKISGGSHTPCGQRVAAADLDHESCWESSFWCRDECPRGLRGGRGGRMALRPGVGFRARLAQRELEYSMKTDEFEMPPMRCRARRSRAVFEISGRFHAPCGQVCRGGSRPRIVLGVEFLVSR